MRVPKIPHRYVIYDKLYRSSVLLLVSFTVMVTVRLGIDATYSMMVKRPLIKERNRYLKEIEFEERRAEREAEMKKQRQLQAQVDATQRL